MSDTMTTEMTTPPDDETYEPVLEPQPVPRLDDGALRKMAEAMLAGAVFTDRHIQSVDDQHHIRNMRMVFMVLGLAPFPWVPQEVGLIYEYMDQAGPRSCNGMPMFMSVKCLHRDDVPKLQQAMDQIRELRNRPLGGGV